jgi:hypothetical protein
MIAFNGDTDIDSREWLWRILLFKLIFIITVTSLEAPTHCDGDIEVNTRLKPLYVTPYNIHQNIIHISENIICIYFNNFFMSH